MASADVPTTLDDAISRGLKPLTEAEFQAFLARHRMIRAPASVINCSQHPPGTKCLEIPGDDGQVVVVYCDDNHNCTRRFLSLRIDDGGRP